MKVNKIYKFMVFIILVVCMSAIVWSLKNQRDLKQHGILVSAKILQLRFGGKIAGGFNCLVTYKGKQIKVQGATTVKNGAVKFIGKTFPGIYLPDTRTLRILITPSDFKNYGVPFPDSLLWVKSFIQN